MAQTKSDIKTLFLALIVMAIWGSLFPFIKIGYSAFNIDAASIPDILMFAGLRFIFSGLPVIGVSAIKKEKLLNKKSVVYILLVGLFSIVLHYAFTYIGLGITDGSKTSIIKQLGTLLYVCFAFLFIKSEKFSILKIIGALVGFTGIAVINLDWSGFSLSFGDIVIIIASVCTVVSSIIIKLKLEDEPPLAITGISQLAGGIVLFAAAVVMGADMLTFDMKSIPVFAYICVASIVSYTLWYYILKTSSLSKMFVIKFAETLFACIFSAILLGEEIFKIQYLAAFILISAGIMLGNRN